MKKYFFLMVFSGLIFIQKKSALCQTYQNVLNYNYNGTPSNGIKIKTNMPFIPGSQMPTIIIEGYNFGTSESIGLILNYYIYSSGSDFYTNPENFYFYSPRITSFGQYTPQVYLCSENGHVVIYINDRPYYQRFTIRAFAQGMGETATHFQGWFVDDEVLSGVKQILVPYQNKLSGTVSLPGSSVWTNTGNLGIGTTNPDAKLSVNGNIHAKEVKVDLSFPAPDYVFNEDYLLTPLSEIQSYIKSNKHLPEVPSAKEMEANGINLSEMNMLLLKKVEELTLHIINQDDRIRKLEKKNK